MSARDEFIAGVPLDLWIGGEWREGADRARFEVKDPATEQSLASVASASADDCLAAVAAAASAFPRWAGRPPRERAEVLRRAFEIMLREGDRLARIMTLENGKSLADSRAEIAYAAEFFRWNAEEAVRVAGEMRQSPTTGARIMVNRKPAGVALLITPWNFPAAMATRKIAPALAAGCGVVVKPASATPLTMLAMMPLLDEAGVPPGLVNVVPLERSAEVTAAMLADDRVRVVSFTGSTAVGRTLLREAAENVVTPAMELGGDAPFIVFDDADLGTAIDGAIVAKMRNMGEACTAANRFFVQSSIADAFGTGLAERMAALTVGNGLDDGVAVGPLISASARQKIAGMVDDAVSGGAKLLTGGSVPDGIGYFYPPTVLIDVPPDAALAREEIFGPVAAIQRFSSEEEVIERANLSDMGLAAYVYGGDLKRCLRVANQLDAGMVGVNRGAISDPAAPFGGVKQSGIGREGGHDGINEYLETQYLSVDW